MPRIKYGASLYIQTSMHVKIILTSLMLSLLFVCCNNAVEESGAAAQKDKVITAPLKPVLSLALSDSIEVLFYSDPQNQKEYRRLVIADTAVIGALRGDIEKDTMAFKECPHHVKMYFFKKSEVFKTVYAATADSCRYFAYAVNSRQYFTGMNNRSYKLIDSLRREAK